MVKMMAGTAALAFIPGGPRSMRFLPYASALFVALALASCSATSDDPASSPATTPSNGDGGDGAPPSSSPDGSIHGLTFGVGTAHLVVAAGYAGSCDLSITRTGGLDDAVTVSAANLPPGVTASDVVLAKNQTHATLTIASTKVAPTTTVTLKATANDEPSVTTSASLTLDVVDVTSGALDPSFGTGGLVIQATTDFIASGTTSAPDGKIIVVGTTYPPGGTPYFGAFRYGADGGLDPTFGQSGRAAVTTVSNRGLAVATVQPDGKIVVGSEAFTEAPMILRLVDDGTLDPTFGSMGQAELVRATWSSGSVYAVSVEPDGAILALATSMRNAAGLVSDGLLIRFLANGALDTTFGGGGVVVSFSGLGGGGTLIRLPDGKHLTQPQGLRVVRLSADGSVDTGFTDTSTTNTTETPPALDADGTVLVGDADVTGVRIRRLTTAGTLDTTFGTAGIATFHFGTLAVPNILVPVAGGGVLVAGWSHDAANAPQELGLARLDATGALHTTFGTSGVTLTPVPSYSATPLGVAVQPDGRIVVVASLSTPGHAVAGFALARYVP